MEDIKLNIELTPAEADEVIAGLNNKALDLEGLAQRILISAQTQYSQIIAARQQQNTVIEDENEIEKEDETEEEIEKENKEGENN